jgi:hypothetical protein
MIANDPQVTSCDAKLLLELDFRVTVSTAIGSARVGHRFMPTSEAEFDRKMQDQPRNSKGHEALGVQHML